MDGKTFIGSAGIPKGATVARVPLPTNFSHSSDITLVMKKITEEKESSKDLSFTFKPTHLVCEDGDGPKSMPTCVTEANVKLEFSAPLDNPYFVLAFSK